MQQIHEKGERRRRKEKKKQEFYVCQCGKDKNRLHTKERMLHVSLERVNETIGKNELHNISSTCSLDALRRSTFLHAQHMRCLSV